MRVEQWRTWCWIGAALALALGFAALGWAVLSEPAVVESASASGQPAPVRPMDPAAVATPRHELDVDALGRADLRPTESEPAPTVTPMAFEMIEEVPPPMTPMNVRLVATAMEIDGASAVFVDERQEVRVVKRGDEIDGATVTRVEVGQVTLDRGGQEVVLELKPVWAPIGPSVSR